MWARLVISLVRDCMFWQVGGLETVGDPRVG